MISGLYIGELTRQIIVKLTIDGVLFGGRSSGLGKLAHPNTFSTELMSAIERWVLRLPFKKTEEAVNSGSYKRTMTFE